MATIVNKLQNVTTAVAAMAMVTFVCLSCDHQQQTAKKQTSAEQNVEDEKEDRYWNLIYEVYECGMAKDEHLLPVIDSLEAAGELSSARADFARGTYYDFAGHINPLLPIFTFRRGNV